MGDIRIHDGKHSASDFHDLRMAMQAFVEEQSLAWVKNDVPMEDRDFDRVALRKVFADSPLSHMGSGLPYDASPGDLLDSLQGLDEDLWALEELHRQYPDGLIREEDLVDLDELD